MVFFFKKPLIYAGLVLLFVACNTTKYLEEGDALLVKNTVEIKSTQKVANESYLAYELSTLVKQKPNTNFFFIPREWFYFSTKDSTKLFGRLARRIGQAPAIYDSSLTARSAEQITFDLQDRGYYNAKVDTTLTYKRKGKHVELNYVVTPDQLYTIGKTRFSSQDSSIYPILRALEEESLLQAGKPVSLELYNQEVTRVTNYFRNNGYNFFRRNMVGLPTGDSTNYQVDLEIEILPPSNGNGHQQYRIGTVLVQPDYQLQSTNISYSRDTVIEGVQFLITEDLPGAKPETLLKKIALRPGKLYSRKTEERTYQKLGTLGAFKFISIKQELDPIQPNIINYRILLTRNQHYEFGADLEANYSDRNITGNSRLDLFGTSLNLSLETRRHPLKGAGLINTNLEGGLEFNIADARLNTLDLTFKNTITIPRFIDYLGIWKTISRSKKRPEGLYRFLEEEVNTKVTVSFNYLSLFDFYTFRSANAAFGYDVRINKRSRMILNHLGIDYLSPTIDSSFMTILDNNPFLRESFGQQLFTGFLVRDLSYYFSTDRPKGSNYAFSASAEVSGLELSAINKLFRPQQDFAIDSIEFARYLRLELNGRYSKIFTPNHSLALRLNFGIASPYSQFTEVPYVKQFSIGGPNSIRAFRSREVGPGSYCSPDVFSEICPHPDFDPLDSFAPFYQTGDLKIEFNAEYRFKLISIYNYRIEGATFLDVGNVWTLQHDVNRAGGQFRFSSAKVLDRDGDLITNPPFYKQLAIGTGFGIRADFSYFVLRLDMGYPLHTPYRPRNAWISELRFKQINFNLAIGYPF